MAEVYDPRVREANRRKFAGALLAIAEEMKAARAAWALETAGKGFNKLVEASWGGALGLAGAYAAGLLTADAWRSVLRLVARALRPG